MVQKIGQDREEGIPGQFSDGLVAYPRSLSLSSSALELGLKKRVRAGTLLQKLWARPLFWALTDALLINIAFALAYFVRYELQWLRAVDPANDVPYSAFLPFIVLLTILLLFTFSKEKVYQIGRKLSWFDEMYKIFNGTTTGIVVMIVIVFVYQPTFYSRIIFLYAGLIVLILMGISRGMKVALMRHWRKGGFGVVRLLIVGAGEVSRTVMRAVVANPEYGYQIVGFVDDDTDRGQTDIGRFKALGGIQNLPKLLDRQTIDEVIIALPWQHHRKIMGISNTCERKNIKVRLVPDMFQMTLGRVDLDELAGVPLIGTKQTSISGTNLFIKRVLDFTVALVGLILASPLMGLIVLAVKMESPGQAIFKQERVGKGNRRFVVYKFRSMVEGAEAQKAALQQYNEADGPLFKIRKDPRITRTGQLLRRLSLDELPQLYNVLRGEMSLVGPRPNIPAEVAQYKPWHRRRLDIVPGMTGMWQVSGRSDLTFDEMALLDIHYLENWSLALDIKILLQTIPTVLFHRGAY